MRSLKSRRVLTLAAASLVSGALLLSGCSAQGTAESDNSSGASEKRSVEHARGTSEVPVNPQRVVVLEPVELDTAIGLGIKPVGAAVASNVTGIPQYLGTEGIEPVGTVPEPDLEAIAALKPDLILGTEARHSKLYDQLNSIAPTVFMKTQADPWQQSMLLIGDALNQRDQAQKLVDDFNTRCEQIKGKLNVSGKTANLIRPRDETKLSLYAPGSFAGGALECVGLSIPEQEWVDGLQADISTENILKAKADYVFVSTNDVNDESTIPAAIRDNRAEFPSVKLVDSSYWISGVGPKGGSLVLDDIEQFLEAQQ